MKQDIAFLNPQETLRLAIVIEEQNAQLYHRLGEMFSKSCPDSPQIAAAFYDLAKTERQHGMLLTVRYRERFGAIRGDIAKEDVRNFIEVPRLNIGDILDAAEAGEVAVARRMALEMALATERNAVNYYVRLVQATTDPELKTLYQELVTFEREHTDWATQAIASGGT